MTHKNHKATFQPTRIGTFIPSLSAGVLRKRGLERARLILEWESIVGQELSLLSLPEKITFPRPEQNGTSGTLYLLVTSTSAIELQHCLPHIRERINQFFGHKAIARIVLRHGLIPPKKARVIPLPSLSEDERQKVADLTAALDNLDLRAVLQRFGETLIQRSKRDTPQKEFSGF